MYFITHPRNSQQRLTCSWFITRYKNVLRWTDSTTVFVIDGGTSGQQSVCGEIILFDGTIHYFKLAPCQGVPKRWTYGLCEMDTSQKTQQPSRQRSLRTTIWLSNLTDEKLPSNVVRCPAHHVTYNFLACDVQSACWLKSDVTYGSSSGSWGVPSPRGCPVKLTALPPSFTCAGGVDGVPYSMVCDHRHDCLDQSDEHFCVFPTCDSMWQYQCRNKQVLSDVTMHIEIQKNTHSISPLSCL